MRYLLFGAAVVAGLAGCAAQGESEQSGQQLAAAEAAAARFNAGQQYVPLTSTATAAERGRVLVQHSFQHIRSGATAPQTDTLDLLVESGNVVYIISGADTILAP